MHIGDVPMPSTLPAPFCIESLIQDYLNGLSIQACAKKYHAHLRRITRLLREANIPLRPAGPQLGVWQGKQHTTESKLKMSASYRALPKQAEDNIYRHKRAATFCPKTGLNEAAWGRFKIQEAHYTCAVTGCRCYKLVVHHLYGVAIHPHLRWNDDNIVVVQKDIHEIFHSIRAVAVC